MPPSITVRISPDETVNDVVRRHPSTLPALKALGIHTCCGGARTLVDAAREDGVDFDTLVRELETAIRASE